MWMFLAKHFLHRAHRQSRVFVHRGTPLLKADFRIEVNQIVQTMHTLSLSWILDSHDQSTTVTHARGRTSDDAARPTT